MPSVVTFFTFFLPAADEFREIQAEKAVQGGTLDAQTDFGREKQPNWVFGGIQRHGQVRIRRNKGEILGNRELGRSAES